MTDVPKIEPAKILLRVPVELRNSMRTLAVRNLRSMNKECSLALLRHVRALTEHV